MPMIVVILPDNRVILLMQLGDFPTPRKTYTFKLEIVPKGGIMNYIRRLFRHKGKHKRGRKNRPQEEVQPNHVIWDYPAKTPARQQGVAAEKRATPNVALEALTAPPARKPRYKQVTLPDLAFGSKSFFKDVHTRFIDRFPPVPSVTCEDFCAPAGLAGEWKYYQELPGFRGLFQHLIILNSFSYWDGVETELREADFHPKGFSVKEFVKWDLLRHSSGALFTTQFQALAAPWDKSVLAGAFDHPELVPEPGHFSYYYRFLRPGHYKAFFLALVRECVRYGLIIPRIAVADGVFLRSWAGNFTKDKAGNPTDPEASITVHGKKHFGKGFTTIAFFAWCGTRCLPVFCTTYTGSISEKAVYQETVRDFKSTVQYPWKALAYDLGADSATNRRLTRGEGMICVMPAKESENYGTRVEIGAKRYFFAEDIPDGMSLNKFGRLYDHRTGAESGFSPLDLAYNMKEMSRMGLAAASIHMYKYFTLLLLHALTAYKVNRSDLVMSSKAFTAMVL